MIRAYKYLFYRLFFLERILFDPVPGVTAFCLLLVLQFFNLFSVYVVLNRAFGFSLPFNWSVASFCCGAALLAVPQYFLLLHSERFKRIMGEFAHESERQRIIGVIVASAYILVSFMFFFWTASLLVRKV